jgi:dTDP-glucose pyrophosphorylase/predicted transcriptional regulator
MFDRLSCLLSFRKGFESFQAEGRWFLGQHRTSVQILSEILSIVKTGARKTRIMYQANLSFSLLKRYLNYALRTGLIAEPSEGNGIYFATQRGCKFLEKYAGYLLRNKQLEDQMRSIAREKTMLEETLEAEYNAVNNETKDSIKETFLNNKASRPNLNKPFTRRTANAFAPSALRGVVLAAGEGSRIKEVTYGGFPKELLPIGGVPTIRFPIEAMRLVGIEDVLIVIAAQTKHGIIDGLQSGERFGVNISYVVQEKNEKSPSGLGSAIFCARGRIRPNDDFVVACGDSILCDFSSDRPLNCLESLIKVHRSTGAMATVLVHLTQTDPTRFGVVKFRSFNDENGVSYGEVDKMIEKPSLKTAKGLSMNGHNYVIVGYYVFKPEIFPYIEKTKPGVKNEVQITDAMALALENGEKIWAVVHGRNDGNDVVPNEYWDVGIPEDYREANKRLLDTNLDKLINLKE